MVALLLLQGMPLAAKFIDPYVVKRKLGYLKYLMPTPGMCKEVGTC